jgi:hypothetical protein
MACGSVQLKGEERDTGNALFRMWRSGIQQSRGEWAVLPYGGGRAMPWRERERGEKRRLAGMRELRSYWILAE